MTKSAGLDVVSFFLLPGFGVSARSSLRVFNTSERWREVRARRPFDWASIVPFPVLVVRQRLLSSESFFLIEAVAEGLLCCSTMASGDGACDRLVFFNGFFSCPSRPTVGLYSFFFSVLGLPFGSSAVDWVSFFSPLSFVLPPRLVPLRISFRGFQVFLYLESNQP